MLLLWLLCPLGLVAAVLHAGGYRRVSLRTLATASDCVAGALEQAEVLTLGTGVTHALARGIRSGSKSIESLDIAHRSAVAAGRAGITFFGAAAGVRRHRVSAC